MGQVDTQVELRLGPGTPDLRALLGPLGSLGGLSCPSPGWTEKPGSQGGGTGASVDPEEPAVLGWAALATTSCPPCENLQTSAITIPSLADVKCRGLDWGVQPAGRGFRAGLTSGLPHTALVCSQTGRPGAGGTLHIPPGGGPDTGWPHSLMPHFGARSPACCHPRGMGGSNQ